MESYVVTQKWKKLIVLTSRPNSAFLPCGASKAPALFPLLMDTLFTLNGGSMYTRWYFSCSIFCKFMTISVSLMGVHDDFCLLIGSSWWFLFTYQEFMMISIYFLGVHDDFCLLIGSSWWFLFTYQEFMTISVYLSGVHDDFCLLIGSSWWFLFTYREFMMISVYLPGVGPS